MSVTSLTSSTAATTTATKPRNGLQELGSDQFINLMVAQMRNQDPMNPTDPSDFLGQIAQFSTVSGVRAMQDSMTDMVSAMRSSQMLSGTSMVGRDVLAASSAINHDGVSAVTGAVELPLGVSSATMLIKDSSGAIVRRFPLSTQAGMKSFAWDGNNDAGAAAPPGRYSIEVDARSANRTESVATLLRSKVDSVSLDSAGGGLILNTTHGATPLSAVRRVL